MTPRNAGFGKQIKLLRAAAGLTQEDLAERAGISVRTVSDLERGLRRTVYPATARRLAESLNVTDERLGPFLLSASGEPSGGERDTPFHQEERAGVPVPLTRLLGREAEMRSVGALLADPAHRLVTLVGPGGIGKTRLAVELASEMHDHFDAGAFFISLSTTDDPHMVVPLIASAMGITSGGTNLSQRLARRLNRARALLVLDTFEHVLPAAPDVSSLLAAAPLLTVLTTSRQSLHLRGEQEMPLGPLAVDAPGDRVVTEAAAVQLFMERATAVAPQVADSLAADVVAEICSRLDGLPLAIELAAARLRHMTLADLRRHLEHRLDPLVDGHRDLPPRQRTMRATLDWSYARLEPAAMRLFRCLGVFRGGFSSPSAAAVARSTAEAGGVMPALSALIDASVVSAKVTMHAESRYHLLDITREYAVERLVAAGELDDVCRRHADHFLEIAQRAEPELRGSDQRDAHARLLADEANFRAALTWALETGEAEMALRLAASLWMFWRWAGLFAEGREWLDASLAAAHHAPVDLRVQGLWAAGWLAFHAGEYKRTEELGHELLQLVGGDEDGLRRRHGLTLLGNAALAQDRVDEAVQMLSEAMAVAGEVHSPWHQATSELNLGGALLRANRTNDAHACFGRALRIYEDLGDAHFAARALVHLGYIALITGDRAQADRQIPHAMEIFASLGDSWAMAEGFEAVATLVSETAPRAAAVLGGAAEQIRDRIAMRQHPPDAVITQTFLRRAADCLQEEEFAMAWNQGRALSPEAALDLALSF